MILLSLGNCVAPSVTYCAVVIETQLCLSNHTIEFVILLCLSNHASTVFLATMQFYCTFVTMQLPIYLAGAAILDLLCLSNHVAPSLTLRYISNHVTASGATVFSYLAAVSVN